MDGDRIVGQFAQGLPGHHQPAELPLLMAPRLIELCFQTAGLWEISTQGRMGLPLHIDRVCVWPAPDRAEGPLYAVVTPHPHAGAFDAEVVDRAGNLYVDLCGYRTVALPDAIDADRLKAMQFVTHDERDLVAAAIT